MIEEGRYLLARDQAWRLHGRRPTVPEIADLMEESPRAVERIRAEMRAWRAATLEEPLPLHWEEGDGRRWAMEAAYALGLVTTTELATLLDLAGRPAGERWLRRWRRRRRAEWDRDGTDLSRRPAELEALLED
jgi:hypothetical protein